MDGLDYKGNIDLDNRKVVKEGNAYKTENSITIGIDGKQIIIPTIVNGKQVSEEDAIKHFKETGEQLGVYDTIEEADKAAQKIHLRQEKKYAPDYSEVINKATSYEPEIPKDYYTQDLFDEVTPEERASSIGINMGNSSFTKGSSAFVSAAEGKGKFGGNRFVNAAEGSYEPESRVTQEASRKPLDTNVSVDNNVSGDFSHITKYEGRDNNYTTKNKAGSSAYGKYQFMPKTAKYFAKKAGIPGKWTLPANQEKIMKYADDYYGDLLVRKEIVNTPKNRYFVHQLGEGRAPRYFKKTLTDYDYKVMNENLPKGQKGKTHKEIYDNWTKLYTK